MLGCAPSPHPNPECTARVTQIERACTSWHALHPSCHVHAQAHTRSQCARRRHTRTSTHTRTRDAHPQRMHAPGSSDTLLVPSSGGDASAGRTHSRLVLRCGRPGDQAVFSDGACARQGAQGRRKTAVGVAVAYPSSFGDTTRTGSKEPEPSTVREPSTLFPTDMRAVHNRGRAARARAATAGRRIAGKACIKNACAHRASSSSATAARRRIMPAPLRSRPHFVA